MGFMKITKQIGPTCGIYAFLNGMKVFYSLEKLDKKRMHEIVIDLLEDNQLPINCGDKKDKIDELKDKNGTTFIGEFFDIDNYVTFLVNNQKAIIEKIGDDYNIDVTIKKISIGEIEKNRNALFISPVLRDNKIVKKKKSNKNRQVLHWISHQYSHDCQKSDKKIEMHSVMDSDSNEEKPFLLSLKEIKDDNYRLNGKKFIWQKYNRTGYCILKKIFLFLTDNSNYKIDSWVTKRMKYKDVYFDSITYKHGEVVMIKMNCPILEFEQKSIEFMKIFAEKKDLPENFLRIYCVRILADDEFIIKYPSYSIKIPSYKNKKEKLDGIEKSITEHKIQEKINLTISYEEYESEVYLSIDVMEMPLEKNLKEVEKIEKMLYEKNVHFERKEHYFEILLTR